MAVNIGGMTRRRRDPLEEQIGIPDPATSIPDNGLVNDAITKKFQTHPSAPQTGVVTRPQEGIRKANQNVDEIIGRANDANDPTDRALGIGPDDLDTGVEETDLDVTEDAEDVGDEEGAGDVAPVAGGAMGRYGTGNIPGAEAIEWGDTSQLRGFDTAKWGAGVEGYEDNSIKNTLGKLMTRVDVSQPNAVKNLFALPEFQTYFPEAVLIEHPKGDMVDFGDGQPVDLILNAVEGGSGEAWQFLTQDAQGGGGMVDAGGTGGGGTFDTGTLDALTEDDQLAKIMAEIDALANGRNPAETEALRALLTQSS